MKTFTNIGIRTKNQILNEMIVSLLELSDIWLLVKEALMLDETGFSTEDQVKLHEARLVDKESRNWAAAPPFPVHKPAPGHCI